MLDPALWQDLIGLPFVLRGRGPEAYDCYGLLMEIFRRQGIVLPDVAYDHADASMTGAIERETRQRWHKTPTITPGAALVFRHGRLPQHVGVALDDNQFIHAQMELGQVVIARLDHGFPRYRPFLLGAYTYAA